MSERLLVVVALAEAAVLCAALCLLLGSAVWDWLRGRRLETRAARAAGAILGLGGEQGGAREQLLALPRGRQLELLTSLAANVGGVEHSLLRRRAEELGLVELAEGWCQSRRWWRRLRGARVLTLLGGGGPMIAPLLDDRRPEVRAQAAEWAAGHADAVIVNRLLAMLEDAEPLCRFTAKDSLRRIGRPALAPLTAFLRDASGAPRVAALEVAAGIAEPELLGPALSLCDDADDRTRAGAAVVVGAIGGDAAVRKLTGLLDDAAPAPRAAAARALGRLGHWPAAPRLAPLLGDPSWEVRQTAALALRTMGAPGVLMLRRALSDDDRFAGDIARQVLEVPSVEVAAAGL